jgi:small-conductance mechanosensitive channel
MIPGAIKALSFHFSKPFSVGDMIAAGTHQGVVDEIDITTTRLNTADGSLVEVKNEELLSAIVIPPGGPHVIAETVRLSVQVSNTEEQFKLLESLCSTALKDIKDVTFTAVRFSDFAGAGVKTDINYSVLAERKVDARHEVVTALLSALKQANIVFTGV